MAKVWRITWGVIWPIRALADASRLDWSEIEPSIFGTLFEKGLDPDKRTQMASLFDSAAEIEEEPAAHIPGLLDSPIADRGVGIHYTDPDTIMKLIEPVVLRPLRAEWEGVKKKIAGKRAAKSRAKSDSVRTRAENEARDLYLGFRVRLGQFRVLDPACGSGNFLYFALSHLKDFDLTVLDEARSLDLPADEQRVGPDAVLGIEINPYAAELARVTIWIGELQWQLKKAFSITRKPILGQLDAIECRDALLDPDGSEAGWPNANTIVGNPPFLGVRRLRNVLGEDYVDRLFAAYRGRVPAEADLVCYWFSKANEIASNAGRSTIGLVATNSIRGGANRRVLDAIRQNLTIFEAWDDEEWVIDGAAVRVSLIAFGQPDKVRSHSEAPRLDGETVVEIHADLSAARSDSGVDLTRAVQLRENANVSFMGDTKGGAFDIPGDIAREWLQAPLNPNGRPNASNRLFGGFCGDSSIRNGSIGALPPTRGMFDPAI